MDLNQFHFLVGQTIMYCQIIEHDVNHDNTDKVSLFLSCINDSSTLWLLVDVIPPNLIVWSIIGIISNLGEAEELNHKEKEHKLVVSSFFVYILVHTILVL